MTFLAVAVLSAFLMPLVYMGLTSLKDQAQITDSAAPVYPATQRTFDARRRRATDPGRPDRRRDARPRDRPTKGREESDFIDPADPGAGTITWDGRWRTLEPVYVLRPEDRATSAQVWDEIDFPKLLRNTVAHRGHRHDRRRRLRDRGGLRLQPLPVPLPRPAVPRRCWPRSCCRSRRRSSRRTSLFSQDRLDGDLAAADRAALLRQRLQRLPAAPVLHDDPARPRRGGDDRRRRARSGSCAR